MSGKPAILSILHGLIIATVFLVPLFVTSGLIFPFSTGKSLLFCFLIEIAFALWLYVATQKKEYRPQNNPLLVAGGVFVLIYTIAGIFGVDPEISFWSSMSRTSGLILLYHIVALVIVLISTVKDQATWNKIFGAVALSGAVVALISYGSLLGKESWINSTFGNTSYAGTYLIFSLFFSLVLFFRTVGTKKKAFFAGASLAVLFSPLLFNFSGVAKIFNDPFLVLGEARATSGAVFIGLLIAGLFYLTGKTKNVYVTICSKLVLGLILLIVVASSLFATIQDSFIQNTLNEAGVGSRLLFWDSAEKGIKERPLLGYGPENYFAPFYTYFEPDLLNKNYGGGGEANADKPHNMYLEVAVTGGILSLLAYLAIFLVAFYLLIKAYREQKIPLIEIGLLFGLLVAYMIQNMLFFDTLVSYMCIAIFIGYVAAVTSDQIGRSYTALPRHSLWLHKGIAIGVFGVACWLFVYMPYMQQANLVKIMEKVTISQRSASYESLFEYSPHGRTSLLIYLMSRMIEAVPPALATLSLEQSRGTLEDINALRRFAYPYIGDNPVHYRLVLSYTRIHFIELLLETDPDKRAELLQGAKKYEEILFTLSPNNPQNYWVRAQRQLFEGNPKEALVTLNETNTLAPNIPATTEMQSQTQKHLKENTPLPFFLY